MKNMPYNLLGCRFSEPAKKLLDCYSSDFQKIGIYRYDWQGVFRRSEIHTCLEILCMQHLGFNFQNISFGICSDMCMKLCHNIFAIIAG
jgi:hypothetical protein